MMVDKQTICQGSWMRPFTSSERGGRCRWCGLSIRLKVNGTLQKHQNRGRMILPMGRGIRQINPLGYFGPITA